jgi:hypothetical protein
MSLPAPAPNKALEPTPYSLRFAPASGRGSPRAFGIQTLSHYSWRESDFFSMRADKILLMLRLTNPMCEYSSTTQENMPIPWRL